jgi:hypothetical protein
MRNLAHSVFIAGGLVVAALFGGALRPCGARLVEVGQ